MDRQIVYPGARPLETDVLNTNKYSMIGLSKLTAAVIGTGTLLNGLACTPGTGLTVSVAAGEIYSAQYVDANAYSTLAADVTHQIVKQGVMMDAVTLSCPAPGSAGQSINYLVQVTFSEVDTNASVLTYYNSSNPSQPYSGPGNSGSAQNTLRQGKCVVAVKAGTAATTGSQTTPAVDAGYTAAYVVTVAYGASSITTGNIVKASGAPFITETLTQKISQTTADARYLQSVNFTFANLGSKPTTVSGFGITDAITTGNIGAQSVSFATTAGRAHPVRGDGASWDLNWSGQSGQPSWLVGSNDGNNFYVYNPANFSVSYSTNAGYATNAGNASNATNATYAALATDATNIVGSSSQSTQDVTASRAINTTYTNSTGKPILVIINWVASPSTFSMMTIDGVSFAVTGAASSNVRACGSFVIRPGGTYSTNYSFAYWIEVR